MARKKTHTERLEELRQAESHERAASREADLAHERARREVAAQREALVEAHASGSNADAKKAKTGHEQAGVKAEELSIRAEAARRRVQRAERERLRYEAENADELLRELAPQASAAREQLSQAAVAFMAAHDRWHAVLHAAMKLVTASPNGDVRTDLPSDHALAPVVRSLKGALRDGAEVISPMPHFQGRHSKEHEEKVSRLVKLRRKSRRTEEDEKNIAQLRRELGTSSGEAA
jgi:hypothetical protein